MILLTLIVHLYISCSSLGVCFPIYNMISVLTFVALTTDFSLLPVFFFSAFREVFLKWPPYVASLHVFRVLP